MLNLVVMQSCPALVHVEDVEGIQLTMKSFNLQPFRILSPYIHNELNIQNDVFFSSFCVTGLCIALLAQELQ